MGQTADSAGEEGIFLCKKLHNQSHGEHTCEPARQTVGKADKLSEQQGGEQDACEQYQKGILQGGMSQDDQGNDVSQTQLHSGNRYQRRQSAFSGIDRERERGIEGEHCQFLCIHV